MDIKHKIILFFVVLDALLFFLFGNLWLIVDNERSLNEVQLRRYESHQLADEFRRSSDDLTRMARTYVVTGDQRFLDYFNQLIAIREGRQPRPDGHGNIYWDFVSADKDYHANPGEKISIIEQFRKLEVTDQELELLEEAKKLSDDLTKMEFQAFNALKGLYLGSDGTYNVRGKPDPELARAIVFGDGYHLSKAEIMEKINRFFNLLETRTKGEIEQMTELQRLHLTISLTLLIIMIGMGIVGYWLFYKDIIRPLKDMSSWVKCMERGQYRFEAGTERRDEIGILTHSFIDMAGKVSDYISNLERVSKTDPLTGLNNRIALDSSILIEMYKFERYGTPCSIIMLDVDHFKAINDRYGHVIGDKVLIETARILQNMTRKSDILGRWGGEEFLVVCPNTTLESGRSLAEMIRQRISAQEFDQVGKVTVSLGVSVFEKGLSAEETIRKADKLMYKAKGEGRDRVG